VSVKGFLFRIALSTDVALFPMTGYFFRMIPKKRSNMVLGIIWYWELYGIRNYMVLGALKIKELPISEFLR
jgi:hypothetical protein